MQTYHRLKVDISRVSYRICRPYQEKIDDFYESGKIRFQWDMIRQAHLLSNDQTLPMVCAQCPLNIRLIPEGCQTELENLQIFLNVTAKYMPEALILNHDLSYHVFDIDEARQLYNDFLALEKILEDVEWPTALVCNNGEPVIVQNEDGMLTEFFYPWEGYDEDTYPEGSEAYYWGRNKSGILVKDSFGNQAPFPFVKLYKEGYGVYGESEAGQTHGFVPVMGKFPTWNDRYGNDGFELLASYEKGSKVFKRHLDNFIVFCEEAMKHNTGITLEHLL